MAKLVTLRKLDAVAPLPTGLLIVTAGVPLARISAAV